VSQDGNRRFAKRLQQPVIKGHVAGFDALLRLLEFSLDFGIEQVTVYAFSQDNFSRAKEEVDGLMFLALEKFEAFVKNESLVMRRGVRVVIVSTSPERLSGPLRAACHRVETSTAANKGPLLNICFSYSGTEEIASAVRLVSTAVAQGQISPLDVSEALLTRVMSISDRPPDLVVRTSSVSRLSDFLLWHVGRAQIFIVSVLWPDISVFLLCCICLAASLSLTSSNIKQRSAADSLLSPNAEKFVDKVWADRSQRWI